MTSTTATMEVSCIVTNATNAKTKSNSNLVPTSVSSVDTDQISVAKVASAKVDVKNNSPNTKHDTIYRRFGLAAARILFRLPLISRSGSPLSSSSSCATHGTIASIITNAPAQAANARDILQTPSSDSVPHVDTECIIQKVNSSSIYTWDESQHIFVGKLYECPPPPLMLDRWQKDIRNRFLEDLILVLQTLPHSLALDKTIVEPELYMLGSASQGSQVVEMRPTIVIRCGSKRCQRAVSKAVAELDYLKTFSKGRIVVHYRPPRLAGVTIDSGLPTSNAPIIVDDGTGVRICRPSSSSACGLRAVIGPSAHAKLCTIGGLIRIGETIYGLTTAHCIPAATSPATIEEVVEPDTGAESESDSETEIEGGYHTWSRSSQSGTWHGAAHTEANQSSKDPKTTVHATSTTHGDREWLAADLGPYSYGAGLSSSKKSKVNGSSKATDFALIKLPWELSALQNTYVDEEDENQVINTITCTSRSLAEYDGCLPVSVLCSHKDVRKGHMLPGEHVFLQGATVFSTKKIQLEEPLERGLSGAWVVRGSSLLGIIVAVYDHEPYAHILEIATIFDSMRALLSPHQNDFRITVDLRYHRKPALHYRNRDLSLESSPIKNRFSPLARLVKWKKSSFPDLVTNPKPKDEHHMQTWSAASYSDWKSFKFQLYEGIVMFFLLTICPLIILSRTQQSSNPSSETDTHGTIGLLEIPQRNISKSFDFFGVTSVLYDDYALVMGHMAHIIARQLNDLVFMECILAFVQKRRASDNVGSRSWIDPSAWRYLNRYEWAGVLLFIANSTLTSYTSKHLDLYVLHTLATQSILWISYELVSESTLHCFVSKNMQPLRRLPSQYVRSGAVALIIIIGLFCSFRSSQYGQGSNFATSLVSSWSIITTLFIRLVALKRKHPSIQLGCSVVPEIKRPDPSKTSDGKKKFGVMLESSLWDDLYRYERASPVSSRTC